ncbi:MAG TPA: hydantoinase B/oxoprolinase family protein [Candidatus Evtepia faecigallinarum]|nr:hydantoinase B/oxoprolinase family protein [Candidatus Evtepia faecigallinarum]
MAEKHVDIITLDIIKDSLLAAGEEIFTAIARTSKSPIIYECLDFASGLTDDKGNLITQGNGCAGFLGMLSSMVKEVIRKWADTGRLKEGDIIIINDPYGGGGSHIQDVGVVMPIFVDGEIFCYTANKCHWSEMGGKDPGYSLNATEIYQEGLQMPCVKLFHEGVLDEDIADIIRANVRYPDLSIGDMWAGVAGLRTGEKRILDLCSKYGKDTVRAAIERLLRSSAEYSRQQVARIPDGVYRAEDVMDKDVHGNGPFHVQVAVTVKGDKMTVDFTGTDKQTAGPINLALAGLHSAMRSVFLACTDPSQNVNDGVFEPLEIIAEEGSLFNAIRPAPVSCYYESMQVALDLVWQALAPVVKQGQLTAGHFLTVGAYTMNGTHAVTGAPFVNCGPTLGGWGAGFDRDGDSCQFCTGDGETFNIPVEILESKFGIKITEYALNTNNAGAGKFRGGYGLILGHEALNDDMDFGGAYGRHERPAWGYAGGQPGSTNGFDFLRKDGSYDGPYGSGNRIPMKKGDIVRMVTGTGGGYGNPLEREEARVAMDVKNEYITLDDAREIYGVEVDPVTFAVTGLTDARKEYQRSHA